MLFSGPLSGRTEKRSPYHLEILLSITVRLADHHWLWAHRGQVVFSWEHVKLQCCRLVSRVSHLCLRRSNVFAFTLRGWSLVYDGAELAAKWPNWRGNKVVLVLWACSFVSVILSCFIFPLVCHSVCSSLIRGVIRSSEEGTEPGTEQCDSEFSLIIAALFVRGGPFTYHCLFHSNSVTVIIFGS